MCKRRPIALFGNSRAPWWAEREWRARNTVTMPQVSRCSAPASIAYFQLTIRAGSRDVVGVDDTDPSLTTTMSRLGDFGGVGGHEVSMGLETHPTPYLMMM